MSVRHLIGAILLGVVSLAPTAGNAAVFGGSNLSFSGYPEFDEYPPSPPYGNDKYAWENYKREIEDYVENANNDISRIKEAKDEAIQKANNAVDEYNRNVRGY
ncbi:hypothetical protein ACJ8PG_23510 [Serratia sp. CY68758]|uniref:hypothetical protein n=1 Tax=Serratia sp. CY68758 TaxID=3383667 RepID=UPI003F9F75A6